MPKVISKVMRITVEDLGITLGQAFREAVGDKKGLRMGMLVPLDEALSRVVIDLSGRPGLIYRMPFVRATVGDFDVDLFHEFFQGFTNHALVTLHIDNLRGENAHHQMRPCLRRLVERYGWQYPDPDGRNSRRPEARSECFK